jgi:hypothetical protein
MQNPNPVNRSARPMPISAMSHTAGPDVLDTQLETLDRLRRRSDMRAVDVLSVRVVTDSVQMIVEISEHGAPAYQAVIAPSGRVHPL